MKKTQIYIKIQKNYLTDPVKIQLWTQKQTHLTQKTPGDPEAFFGSRLHKNAQLWVNARFLENAALSCFCY